MIVCTLCRASYLDMSMQWQVYHLMAQKATSHLDRTMASKDCCKAALGDAAAPSNGLDIIRAQAH